MAAAAPGGRFGSQPRRPATGAQSLRTLRAVEEVMRVAYFGCGMNMRNGNSHLVRQWVDVDAAARARLKIQKLAHRAKRVW